MTENGNNEKKKWINRHVIKSGIPVFSCVDSYVEKTDRTRHIGVDEETFTALQKVLSEYEDSVSMALVAGDIISDAAEKGWQPYEKPCNFKMNFKNLDHDITISITKSVESRLAKLADASGVKISDYIRLAFSWNLVMGKSFSEKPF